MSQVTHLASGALNRSGDKLSIELHQPANSPSFVMVVWPAKPSINAPTPKALAALAAARRRDRGGHWLSVRPLVPRSRGKTRQARPYWANGLTHGSMIMVMFLPNAVGTVRVATHRSPLRDRVPRSNPTRVHRSSSS